MSSKTYPLAFLASANPCAFDTPSEFPHHWINAKQIAAYLHIPENRVYRFAGSQELPAARLHEPSGRLLWQPNEVKAAAAELPANATPVWLSDEEVADWLGVSILQLGKLVALLIIPEPTREWRGVHFWRPAEIRDAVAELPGGFGCDLAGL